MKLPVVKAIGASMAFLFTQAGEIVKALWLPLLAVQAATAYFLPKYMTRMLDFSAMDPGADPAIVMQTMGPAISSMALMYLCLALLWPMAIAGNLRHLVRGETAKLPFYFGFGADELRILLSYILLAIMFFLAYLVGALALFVLGLAGVAASPVAGGLIAGVGALAFLIALVWFLLRMSMTFPATIGARRIGISQSWRLTRGNAWRLLFYFTFWGLIYVALLVAFLLAALPAFFEGIAQLMESAGDPVAEAAFQKQIIEAQLEKLDPSNPGFWLFFAASYAYAIVATAILNVSTGVAYRYLVDKPAA